MSRDIVLENLREKSHLSKTRCDAFVEACIVCLEQQQHQSGVDLSVEGAVEERFRLLWHTPITEAIRTSWDDADEATEEGACALAFWIMLETHDLTVIRRSRKSTGFDYWLGRADGELFQEAGRLEISGIREGNDAAIRARARDRARQTRQSDELFSHLPAYIVIVEFSHPKCFVEVRHVESE